MSDLNADSQLKASIMAALALDKKAEGLKLLQVSEKTSYTDYLVICSAPSERQVQAVARNILDEMRLAGVRPLGQEGLSEGHWVLLDFGEVVAHIFFEGARTYYDLDGFWEEVPEQSFDEASAMSKLKEAQALRQSTKDQAAL